jgi:hypothetical protein
MSNERFCVSCGADCVAYTGDVHDSAVLDHWAPLCTPCADTLRRAVQEAIDGNTEGAQATIGRFAHEVEARLFRPRRYDATHVVGARRTSSS